MNPGASPGPDWAGLAWMALPLLVCMATLALGRLGQVRPLAIATVRMVVQLSILGLVLGLVFASRNPWVAAGVALVMLSASAHAAGSRQSRPSWSLRTQAFVTMGLSLALVMAIAVRLSLGVEPWYEPSTFVPLVGMILGNSVNGVALGAERLDSAIRADRDRIELRLALGATAWQAAATAMQDAVRAGLTPTINGMMIAGIVAIPGMATGQILAGADVATALRYQMLIYLAIAGTVGLSLLGLLALRFRRYFTADHQLRQDLPGPG